MNTADMQHIPLSSAFLCQTCQEVGNCERQCPACASINLMPLASVLDRPQSRSEAQGARGEGVTAYEAIQRRGRCNWVGGVDE